MDISCFLLGSADDIDIYGASVSDDDDDDADPLPWESSKPLKPDDPLLPDGSSSKKLSPLLLLRPSHSSSHSSRPDSERPVISKVNLKNFSGLEGVSSLTLSTQDSVETSSSTNTKSSTSISTTNTGTSNLNINTAAASDASPSLGSSLVVTSAKRSIQAEKSAPLTATNYGKVDTNSPSSPMAPSTSSSTLFSKVGKSTKKHSLDEEFLNSGTSGKDSPFEYYYLKNLNTLMTKCSTLSICHFFRYSTFYKLSPPFNYRRPCCWQCCISRNFRYIQLCR